MRFCNNFGWSQMFCLALQCRHFSNSAITKQQNVFEIITLNHVLKALHSIVYSRETPCAACEILATNFESYVVFALYLCRFTLLCLYTLCHLYPSSQAFLKNQVNSLLFRCLLYSLQLKALYGKQTLVAYFVTDWQVFIRLG